VGAIDRTDDGGNSTWSRTKDSFTTSFFVGVSSEIKTGVQFVGLAFDRPCVSREAIGLQAGSFTGIVFARFFALEAAVLQQRFDPRPPAILFATREFKTENST